MYHKRQRRTLAFHSKNQSNQHHMSNLMEIDIFHARILRHSLEFDTVLGCFFTETLKNHTVLFMFGFDEKSRVQVLYYCKHRKPLEITWDLFEFKILHHS